MRPASPQLQLESLRHTCACPCAMHLLRGKCCVLLSVGHSEFRSWLPILGTASSWPSYLPYCGTVKCPEGGEWLELPCLSDWLECTVPRTSSPRSRCVSEIFHFYVGGARFVGMGFWSISTDISVVLCSPLCGVYLPRRVEQLLKHVKHCFKKKLLLFLKKIVLLCIWKFAWW